MLISLTQFLVNAKAQNEVIKEYEGIIIYYETDSIPQDVFFLPCKIEYDGAFKDFAIEKIKNYKGELNEIFFQGIRWGMPDLLAKVQSMNYLTCKRITGNGGFLNMRLSAGKIFVKVRPNFNKNLGAKRQESFLLELQTQRYSFISIDFDFDEEGLPVFFEPFFLR